jgi:mannobiose 2-epimerase
MFLLGVCGPLSAEHPSAAELREQAGVCRDLLNRSVIDFYLPHSLDTVHGGYLETLDAEGRFYPEGGKFLVLQARQLWLFSTLAEAGIRRDQTRAAADSGYRFLQEHFLDRQHGGYISRVAREGAAEDSRKHVYLNSFALYGLVAYYRATKDREVLEAAWQLFDALDSHAYDQQHRGYQEFFDNQWRPITDPVQSGYVGAINTKTYNTHLHLLESFTALYRVSPQPRLASRLSELLLINTRTVQHPEFPCNIDGWARDWTMIDEPGNRKTSYGHDVECAWLVFDAARAIDMPLDPLRGWAVSLVDYSLRFGWDQRHGGFFYTGPLGQPASDRRKEWWVQSEALVAMRWSGSCDRIQNRPMRPPARGACASSAMS